MLLTFTETQILRHYFELEEPHPAFTEPSLMMFSGSYFPAEFHNDGPHWDEYKQDANAQGRKDTFKKGFYWARITGSLPLYYDGDQFHECTAIYDVHFKTRIEQTQFRFVEL